MVTTPYGGNPQYSDPSDKATFMPTTEMTPRQLQLPLELSAECEAFIAGFIAGYKVPVEWRLDDHLIHKALRKYLEAQRQESLPC